ncbi:NAD(P)H-binding protein [Leuconostoc citreum]|jgi:nucleoside-diphosphate-sugar epimerase|uniref:NADH dehydrogenase n=2 Tax=Leuconostoc citreum TaxID=33964 RepID=B1MXA4_LEUCK|nr:NAD(P)H-binding protein [Leuconostoc citreum]ACA82156.1 NADH dehydrogenase [Leuconostoc citreum KM20]MCK8606130.1 NAD(P)H-binding protein [Leuconostoc citreum]MCP1276394.1 NAD(P)H-binding protein [Leuconostoc citreum]MCS8584052.1 NAD-dependent epimerase/dehydratase family protein [Leuconostoc citreum]MCS8600400.1 NAD-dependent epimerase/dehydratase family protein [Leuconostoc citreum]
MTTTKQKIVIAGGTGFVGQGIIKQLPPQLFDVHSLSRHGRQPKNGDSTTYHAVDFNQPDQLQAVIMDADWVIDAIGILLPNPIKKQNYQNSSYEPAKKLIDVVVQSPKTKFLFVSANTGPFFMRPYLKAKRAVEKDMAQLLPKRSFSVYPGIIFDKDRTSSYLPGLMVARLRGISYFYKLRAIPRTYFAKEIKKILLGHRSELQQRRV